MEEQQQTAPLFGLNIDSNGSSILRISAQWAKTLAILGIILGIISFVVGIILYNQLKPGRGGYYRSAVTLASIYLITFTIYAVIFFVSSVFMFNFSNKTIAALNTNDQVNLNAGFTAIKNAIIFWTIVFIVFLLLFVLMVARF